MAAENNEVKKLEKQWKDIYSMVLKRELTAKLVSKVFQNIADGEFEIDMIPQWIENLAIRNSTMLDLTKFKRKLKRYGRNLIERWQSLRLEPYFLQKEIISVTPSSTWEDWYSQQVKKGKILRLQANGELIPIKGPEFGGISVLIDIRARPLYQNGKQGFKNDNLLGPIMKNLRRKGEIRGCKKCLISSRFGSLGNDWQNKIRPILAKSLNLKTEQVRLETVPEKMLIPWLYPDMPRHKDVQVDTWEWCEEFFEDTSQRLCVGSSKRGGISYVLPERTDIPCGRTAFRPLIVL